MVDNLHNPAANIKNAVLRTELETEYEKLPDLFGGSTPAPPPGILVAGHFDMPYGYFATRPSGTRDWLITLTFAGSGSYRFGDKDYVCRAGDVAILSPGTPHDYRTSAPEQSWDFQWAHFVPRPHWAQWLQFTETERGFVHLHIADDAVRARIGAAFGRVVADSVGQGALTEELALNALEEIVLLLQRTDPGGERQPVDPRISQTLEAMARNLADDITVQSLAKLVHLSPSRLAHLFKEQTGDSVMETVQKMRLRQAARLLEYTQRHVSDIAGDVGFHSLYYFSRQFSAFYGMSPTAYRKVTQRYKEQGASSEAIPAIDEFPLRTHNGKTDTQG